MKIIINNDISEFDIVSREEMDEVWRDVTKSILDENKLIYCVDIDGMQYFDDYANELLSRCNDIVTVRITTITEQQSYDMTWTELNIYCERVIEEMGKYIKPLYVGSTESSQTIISTVVSSVQWIGTSMLFLQQLSQQVKVDATVSGIVNQFIQSYEPVIELLSNEIEWGNFIGFADIIQYEFLPLIEGLVSKSKEVKIAVE